MWNALPEWAQALTPIVALLVLVVVVVARLPKIDLGHSVAFIRRRRLNWIPLGLTYAFLYMGRYNLTRAKAALDDVGLMSTEQYGTIGGWGTFIYGCSFLINGPLTDRLGGRRTIMIAALGSAVMNLLMGLVLATGTTQHLTVSFSVLYSANMYFQSFGAVSIVKVNAHWFHVRERGMLGGVFGILISLGIYFAYDWNLTIIEFAQAQGMQGPDAAKWVFLVPSALLLLFCGISYVLVYDTPSDRGFEDFDVADASSGDDGPRLSVAQVFLKMMRNPVVVTIAAIEFCSGYLRQAIMQWGPVFLKGTGQAAGFVNQNWGMLLCMAGITGGMFAGTISDHLFGSRRGPVATVLYAGMVVGSIVMMFLLDSPVLGIPLVGMSLCIIGVHGMLSGTASMDFGGKKNAGVAVGIIDGFVYLGTALQFWLLGEILPKDELAADTENWSVWPRAMLPLALIGVFLASRIWSARPTPVKLPDKTDA